MKIANKKITINAMESVVVHRVLRESENFKIQYQLKGDKGKLSRGRIRTGCRAIDLGTQSWKLSAKA